MPKVLARGLAHLQGLVDAGRVAEDDGRHRLRGRGGVHGVFHRRAAVGHLQGQGPARAALAQHDADGADGHVDIGPDQMGDKKGLQALAEYMEMSAP